VKFDHPFVRLMAKERRDAVAVLFGTLGWSDLSDRSLLEVGCGSGGPLSDCLALGFTPERVCGIDVDPYCVALARRSLPGAVRLITGDALESADCVAAASQDVVLQSTVFSSLLDDSVQTRLADQMWRWVRPGGGVLWYDFIYNNPWNRNVRGVPVKRIRQLFPEGRLRVRRLTLAPPIGRAVTDIHESLYKICNVVPWLRTHVLVWISKPTDSGTVAGPGLTRRSA